MINFKKTAQEAALFDEFTAKIEKTIDTLSPYSDIARLHLLERVRDDFKNRIDDFFRAERKLNIGIIGQVKAGKSSFLNTLLFDGKNVLPSAATPKTATLTRIEYAEENTLDIEYYTPEEWQVIEKNALTKDADGNDMQDSEFESAREIMSMIKSNGITPADYTSKGTDTFVFESVEKLMTELNSYVGENGKYTPLVKCATIHIAKGELREISVVDTPGLNDPIISRTDKTREFIEKCDVVFFLSHASHFLDKTDNQLLTVQLPQNGVQKIIMIGSMLDDSILGVFYDSDCETLAEAVKLTRKKLTDRAVSAVKLIKIPNLAKILEQCQKPIMISSMCWNMSKKNVQDFNEEENNIIESLSEISDIDSEILKDIGNINSVQKEFEKVISNKDETLSAKAKSFLPNAEKEYTSALSEIRSSAEKTLEILRTGDRAQLDKASKELGSQINDIRGGVETVFGEMLQRLEATKIETLHKLRDASREYSQLNERTGTEEHTSSYKVSDFTWRHPFKTFGKYHYETSSYTTSYSYLDASDALENIRLMSLDAQSDIENTFYTAVNIAELKRRLLSVIVECFDTSSDSYDPTLLRLITQETVNSIEFPPVKIDVSAYRNSISSRFSGEVRSSSDRSALRALISDTINDILEKITEIFTEEVSKFKTAVNSCKSTFLDKLLENIQAEFDDLRNKLEDKEKQIKTYETFLTLLKTV